MTQVQVAAIVTTGAEVLYRQAQPVTEFNAALGQLARTLMLTMEQASGVGIAAPQIGVSQRLFIVASRPNERYPDAPEMAPLLMVNPELLGHSEETEDGEEGCLSVPGTRLSIARYRWVDARWQDAQGKHHQQRLDGFIARIFQHELDHLDGITLLERVQLQERSPA